MLMLTQFSSFKNLSFVGSQQFIAITRLLIRDDTCNDTYFLDNEVVPQLSKLKLKCLKPSQGPYANYQSHKIAGAEQSTFFLIRQ